MTAEMRAGERGYVLLAAMVAAAMGLAAALAAMALAETAGRVVAADGGAERALAAARAGVTDAADRLVWGGLSGLWRGIAEGSFDATVGDIGSAGVTVRRAGGTSAAAVFQVESRGSSGAAAATENETVVVRPLGLPRGITVAGDLRAGAAITADGCGAYVGGDVWGREQVVLGASDGGGAGPDRARPDLWPVAAVHADGRIYADGREIHQAGQVSGDTDSCGGFASGREVWPPAAETLALFAAHAVTAASLPLAGGTIDLAELSARWAAARVSEPQSGRILLARPAGGSVAVSGWWPQADTSQITLIVEGDAEIVADAGESGAAVHGALLVTGELRVGTPTLVVGFLAAGTLVTEAPLSVVLPGDWEERPPPGSYVAVRTSAPVAGSSR
jgi:hypothetical protein